jgi:hypothetical protein
MGMRLRATADQEERERRAAGMFEAYHGPFTDRELGK